MNYRRILIMRIKRIKILKKRKKLNNNKAKIFTQK